jgi:serine/threonine protein kinase
MKHMAGMAPDDDLPTTFASNLVSADSPERFHQQFEEGAVLGEGITGTVKVVKRKDTGEEYAMKTINLARIDKAQLDELNNEIRILRALDHPNVVRLLSTFSDKTHIYMM